ncbi:MAG TPA: hypothetical protein VK043_16645 [Burkholderiales bacterium]|nr:hypothetical protein [Burkholderiales bacterium]
MSCARPLELETLVAYWLGELPAAVEAPLEEHVFGCAHCTRRLEALAAFSSGVRAAVKAGLVAAVITSPLLEEMKRQGMRIREYAPSRGGTVACTIAAEDDLVVGRLAAPLAGVTRLDLRQIVEIDGRVVLDERLEDIPFDPAAGEVLSVPSASALKKMPAHVARLRLIAVEGALEREIGEYAFAHAPSPQ